MFWGIPVACLILGGVGVWALVRQARRSTRPQLSKLALYAAASCLVLETLIVCYAYLRPMR